MIIFNRVWEMPSGNTYDIKCINKLIHKYLDKNKYSIDPFANKSKIATVTNDINPEFGTTYNLDAKEFLLLFEKDKCDLVLFDPPYSLRQVSECYKAFGKTVNMETTQSSFWSNMKKQIAHITKPGGGGYLFRMELFRHRQGIRV